MSVLLADIGNSSIKLCRCEVSAAKETTATLLSIGRVDSRVSAEPWAEFVTACEGLDSPSVCYLASVNDLACERLSARLATSFPNTIICEVTADTVPMPTDVQSRQALGIDRLLAAYAAAAIVCEKKNAPLVVIDAGTAVTIDYVDEAGVFQGGVIFPGLETSFGSLRHATSALPDATDQLRDVSLDTPIGKSTDDAIVRGVAQAQVGAITHVVQNIIDSVQTKVSPVVVATGGGLTPLKPWLPTDWKFVPDLVLHGLARVANNAAGGVEQ